MPKIPVYQMKKDIIYGRVPKKKQPYKFDFESAERAPYVDDGLDHYDEEAQMSTIAGKRDPFLDYMAMKRSQPTERVQEEDPYAGIDPDAEALPALPEMEFNKPEDYYDEERQQSMMTPRKMSKERPSKDDLMSYLQGKMGKKSLQEEAEEPVDMAKTVRPTRFTPERLAGYRNQRFMNDIIPAVAKAGAMIGTVGGRSPKSVIERDDTDYRAQDEAREDKENARSDRKEALYEALREKMSDNALNRQRMDQEAQRFGLTHDLAKKGLEQKEFESSRSFELKEKELEQKDPVRIIENASNQQSAAEKAKLEAEAAKAKAEQTQALEDKKHANKMAQMAEDARLKAEAAKKALGAKGAVSPKQPAEDKLAIRKLKEANNRYNTMLANAERLKQKFKTTNRIEAFNPEATSMDAALHELAIDFAKMSDPESVAREGEVKASEKYQLPIRKLGGALYSQEDKAKIIDEFMDRAKSRLSEIQRTHGMTSQDLVKSPESQRGLNTQQSKAKAALEKLKKTPGGMTDPKYQSIRDYIKKNGGGL